MNKTLLSINIAIFLFTLTANGYNGLHLQAESVTWKAGVAKIKITPLQDMWMAGYASRTHKSQGKYHDLWAKALATEDPAGKRFLLITADLLGITREASDIIKHRLSEKYGLGKADILINCSHTHSGPVLRNALTSIYDVDEKEKKVISKYTDWLIVQIITVADLAIKNLEPSTLSTGSGVVRFQVNRRNNSEARINAQSTLLGPNDFAVPVIKVLNRKRKVIAIVFGYACHATVLNDYKLSGDYPGFAQVELEKNFQGAIALFFQGAGADLNPLPRRSVSLAIQYGKELAAAVERVLADSMQIVEGLSQTAYKDVDIPLTTAPTQKQLTKILQTSQNYEKRWASQLLEELDKNNTLPAKYSYPVQILKLGNRMIIALGGELVVGYSIRLKNIFGSDIFVMGYSNDVMAYIPDSVILKEGGYEGSSSQKVYGLPSDWAPEIESTIINTVSSLAAKLGETELENKN